MVNVSAAYRQSRQRSASHAPPRRCLHTAFTLLEVILVMSLIVAVVSLAATSMRGSVRRQRLVKAAEQVRNEWARARLEAIKKGRVHVFHHAMERGRFLVVPQTSFDDPMPSFGAAATPGAMSTNSLSSTMADPMRTSDPWAQQDTFNVRERELPDQVMFLAANVQFDQRSAVQLNQTIEPSLVSQAMTGPQGFEQDPIQDQQWGTPIYFFPDGSSSSAELILMNEQNESISVYLRGMTGIVRVGKILKGNPLGLSGAAP